MTQGRRFPDFLRIVWWLYRYCPWKTQSDLLMVTAPVWSTAVISCWSWDSQLDHKVLGIRRSGSSLRISDYLCHVGCRNSVPILRILKPEMCRQHDIGLLVVFAVAIILLYGDLWSCIWFKWNFLNIVFVEKSLKMQSPKSWLAKGKHE